MDDMFNGYSRCTLVGNWYEERLVDTDLPDLQANRTEELNQSRRKPNESTPGNIADYGFREMNTTHNAEFAPLNARKGYNPVNRPKPQMVSACNINTAVSNRPLPKVIPSLEPSEKSNVRHMETTYATTYGKVSDVLFARQVGITGKGSPVRQRSKSPKKDNLPLTDNTLSLPLGVGDYFSATGQANLSSTSRKFTELTRDPNMISGVSIFADDPRLNK